MGTIYFIPVAVLILLITAGFTQIAIHRGLGEEWSWAGVYLAVFYPVCDLLQGAAALWLSVLFGRRMILSPPEVYEASRRMATDPPG